MVSNYACEFICISDSYCINQELVKIELKRLLYLKTYLPQTCLSRMRLIDDCLADPALPASPYNRQYALGIILTQIIRSQYMEQRLLFRDKNQEPASYQTALYTLSDDAQIGSSELRAWSYLYYLYVRVELGISHNLYAQVVCSNERNARRWHKHGIARLTMKLIEAEHQARRIWNQRLLIEPGLSPEAHPIPRPQLSIEEE